MNESLQEKLEGAFGAAPTDASVNEIVVNRAGEFGVERSGAWQWCTQAELTPQFVATLCGLVGSSTNRKARDDNPVLSGPAGGGRALVVLPPVAKFPSLTIRKASAAGIDHAALAAGGLYERTNDPAHGPAAELVQLKERGQYRAFMELAVRSRLTVAVAGPIGSGKTTLAGALAQFIDAHERVITIESPSELRLPHRNLVQLEYDADAGESAAGVTASRLLRAAKRMRPDRVLLGECRGEEAFDLLDIALSGHPGGITTLHARSVDAARLQLRSYALRHRVGAAMGPAGVDEMIAQAIDVIVVIERRRVTDIWLNPRVARHA